MSQRYDVLFEQCKEQNRLAWIPFVMLGYPTLDKSYEYILNLIDAGADALEIGIPFSDPVADGPVIQEAARVALEQGITVAQCLATLAKVRDKHAAVPMGLLIYANLAYRPGISNFYNHVAQSGVDSVLIADVPGIEAEPFAEAAYAADVDPVFIAPPNASEQSLELLVKYCRGYTYVVSRAGVTGNHQQVEYPLDVLQELKTRQAPPAVLGFGISQPEHVVKAAELGFAGVISGTAVIKIMQLDPDNAGPALMKFSRSMRAACE